MGVVRKFQIFEIEVNNNGFSHIALQTAISNVCERLFSVASFTMNDLRKGVLSHLKSKLLLHVHRQFWAINDVHCLVSEKNAPMAFNQCSCKKF